jgi:UDP-glucose 4-epimerase
MTQKRHRWRDWSRRREKVVITGIGGRLGKALARRLHREWEVVGIDRRSVDTLPRDIEFHQVDIRRRKAEDVFRTNRIDALIHLNIMHDPRKSERERDEFNVLGTQKILHLCQQHNVGKVVVLSSANVYGPAPSNNQFLTEEAPLMGSTTFSAIGDLVVVDMYASSFFWRHPEIETVILRPVHIVGHVNNAPSKYLRLGRIPTLMGYDPMIQIIHIEDVVEAMAMALKPGIRGIYNIAGPGELPLSELVRALGKVRVPLPELLARPLFGLMWRTHLTSFPTPELDHIKYVCMVDDSRARQNLGYSPKLTLKETIAALT